MPIHWIGSTRDDLRDFPATARLRMGYQLRRVQSGKDPDDWKPMTEIGPGCREIRVRSEDGRYRSLYVVGGTPRGVYVLAVFSKKTQKTPEVGEEVGEEAVRGSRGAYERTKAMSAHHPAFDIVTTADPWDVVADSREEAENLRVRAEIMDAIRDRITEFGWSQSTAATHLGITQPRVSDLCRGKIDKFSLDALVNLGRGVGVRVTVGALPHADQETAST